jgi:hypothetical protein
MTRWFGSLLLLVALASGVFAGSPLKSGEKECAMSKRMKCCKRNALGQANIREKSMAKLCGTLFCEHSGTTSSTVQIPQFSTLIVAILYFHTLKPRAAKQAKIAESDYPEISLSRQKTSLFIQHHAFRI